MATTNKEYWRFWLWRDNTARLITINTAVWIVIAGAMLFLPVPVHSWWVSLFAIPAYPADIPYRIWTIATYMVSQFDFLHLLVNMLWLMLFGRLLEMLLGSRKMLLLYIGGGLAGAAAFIVANLCSLGHSAFMIGASCSVICLVGVAAMMMPTYRVPLLIFGNVKLIWIAVAAIVLFVVIEPSLYVSIAHCGGLLAGMGYVLWRRWHRSRLTFPWPKKSTSDEQRLDQLLAKVSRSGYSSLTAGERQTLFDLSQRLKK